MWWEDNHVDFLRSQRALSRFTLPHGEHVDVTFYFELLHQDTEGGQNWATDLSRTAMEVGGTGLELPGTGSNGFQRDSNKMTGLLKRWNRVVFNAVRAVAPTDVLNPSRPDLFASFGAADDKVALDVARQRDCWNVFDSDVIVSGFLIIIWPVLRAAGSVWRVSHFRQNDMTMLCSSTILQKSRCVDSIGSWVKMKHSEL